MGGCASKTNELNGEADAPVGLEEPLVVSDPTVGVKKAEKSLGVLFMETEEKGAETETPKLQEDVTEDLEAEPPKIQEHTAEALEHKADPSSVEQHLDLEAKAETPKTQEHTSEALEPKPEPPTEALEPKSETPKEQEHSGDVTDPDLVVAEEKSAGSVTKAEVQPVEEVAAAAATKKKEGVASFFLKQIMVKNFLVKLN